MWVIYCIEFQYWFIQIDDSVRVLAAFPHGSVRVDDGNMTHFVADKIESAIKAASPKDGN